MGWRVDRRGRRAAQQLLQQYEEGVRGGLDFDGEDGGGDVVPCRGDERAEQPGGRRGVRRESGSRRRQKRPAGGCRERRGRSSCK